MPGNDDIALLDSAIKKAGEIARAHSLRAVESWAKHDGSPVSEADLAVDSFLKNTLCDARPDYGWLSEETADDETRLSRQRVWIVDPIDGTKSFLAGTRDWCVVAALIEKGRPILARVYNPMTAQIYAAEIGKGARLNGQPVKSSRISRIEQAKVMAHKGVFTSDKWANPLPDIRIDTIASLSLRLCQVVSGAVDGTLATGEKFNWDLAAGDLLIKEAGGKVSDLSGKGFSYDKPGTKQPNGLLAAGVPLYDKLLAFTRTHKAGK